MEKLSSFYGQDDKAFSAKKSEINYRNKSSNELEGIDGSYSHVSFEVAMKTPDKRHFVNYGRHNTLANDIDFFKVQESKPRLERVRKAGYIGAKLLTRGATKMLAEHNSVIKDAYRVGTVINESAYTEASVEDKNREAGLELGSLANKGSLDFSKLIRKNISESASVFDKLDLVRERALDFAGSDSRKFIIKGDTSTIVMGNSSRYIPEWYESRMISGGGYTLHAPSAFKLSVMEDAKSGKDKMLIDVYKFNEFQEYYFPVSRTTLHENDSALIEKYDTETAQYSAPEKLNKSELQNMYSHLILGDNILG